MAKKQITYEDSGVNIKEADRFVDYITKTAKKTYSGKVLSGIGGFAAASMVPKGYKNPILVSCTDGVGTKLKIAFELNKNDTVGIDLVAMSVNDLITLGAKPLFFLDYLATGKLKLGQAKEVIKGIIEGCKISDCALIGGETAEMPDFYQTNEYDLAGFAVGIVDKDKVINGRTIKAGDKVIGLASSGLHSNGYSLVRKLIKPKQWKKLAGILLKPTRIYARTVSALIKEFNIKGIAHITGGGLLENVPRILPSNININIEKNSWPLPWIFKHLQKVGNIPEKEMYRTFNMGIGMVIVVPGKQADKALKFLRKYEKAYIIGKAVKGKQAVELI